MIEFLQNYLSGNWEVLCQIPTRHTSQLPLLLMILIIGIIIIISYAVNQSKDYKPLINMLPLLEMVQKKARAMINSFQNEEITELKESLQKFSKEKQHLIQEINKIKKKNNISTILIPILGLVLMSAGIMLSYAAYAGLIHPPESPEIMPDTNATCSIDRINTTQIYVLSAINNGETFANRLRMQVGFDENVTITDDVDVWPPQTRYEDAGGKGTNYYHIIFTELQVGEEARIMIYLTSTNFTEGETKIVEPEYQNVWTWEETKIEIKSVS